LRRLRVRLLEMVVGEERHGEVRKRGEGRERGKAWSWKERERERTRNGFCNSRCIC
jgi:hypothetical protein